MFSILYRDLPGRTSTLFEMDSLQEASLVLVYIATLPEDFELIDFSPELDGALDYALSGVRLFPGTAEEVAA